MTDAIDTTPEKESEAEHADRDTDERGDQRERCRRQRSEHHDQHDGGHDQTDRLADAEDAGHALADRGRVRDVDAVDRCAGEVIDRGGLRRLIEFEHRHTERHVHDRRGAILGDHADALRHREELRTHLCGVRALVELGLLGVQFGKTGGDLLGLRVELGLLGIEFGLLRVELLCRHSSRLELRTRAVDLRLGGVKLRLTGVELGLPGLELFAARVELGLAVGELLFGIRQLLRLLRALLLGGEGVDHGGTSGSESRTVDELGDLRLLLGAQRRAVSGGEEDRPRRTGVVGQLLGQRIGHLAGRRARDVEVRGERAEADEEGSAGDGENGQPGEDHQPGATRREFSKPVQQFSHVVPSVKSGLSRYGTECLVAKSVIEFPARAQPGCGADSQPHACPDAAATRAGIWWGA